MAQRRRHPTNVDEYLMNFFVQILLMVLKMPDELIDTLEEACKEEKSRRAEIQKRLSDLKQKEN